MKFHSSLLCLLPVALAAPRQVVLQESLHKPSREALPDLTADDFIAVQQTIKESLSDVVDNVKDRLSALEALLSTEDALDPHHPHKHPLPPPFLDFSNYTVLEIVNASFVAHSHDGKKDGGFSRKIRRGGAAIGEEDEAEHEHHKPDPSHLPLHRLAHLINFSPEAAALLEQDDITLLAPDNWALTPPHKREEHSHSTRHGRDFAPFDVEDEDDFDFGGTAPHPFHSGELACPKRLSKLAASVDGDEDEKKKAFFKKLIAVIGKYHIIPKASHPRELADRSTVPSLLEESRIRVAPYLERFPFPHPSLKFNVYSRKRGPVIKAKNGIILLVSAPLLPPLTPLNQLFLTPKYFSGFTNAVQKVDLDDVLLPDFNHSAHVDANEELDFNPLFASVVDELVEEHKLKQFTVFVFTNAVFDHLPLPAVAFLHSPLPFAKKVLKYLIGGHISPVTFFSDFYSNSSSTAEVEQYVVRRKDNVEVPTSFLFDHATEGPHHPPHHPPHHGPPPPHHRANVTHYNLPTLLTHFSPNATIKAAVFEYHLFGFGPKRRSIVIFPHHPPHHEEKKEFGGEGHEHKGPHPVRVAFADLPARAGAIHVLGDQFLLPPPPPHHEEKTGDSINVAATREAVKFHKAIVKLFA